MPVSAPLAIMVWLICALLVWVAARFYGRRMARVFQGEGLVDTSHWRPADLALALPLGLFFGLNVAASLMRPPHTAGVADMQHGVILFMVLITGIVISLLVSSRNPVQVFGLDKQEGWAACGKGVGYLILTYPLIAVAMILVGLFWKGEMAPQEPVRLFVENSDWGTAKWVIIAAILVAPVAEELIFRGYFYGIAKRFLGTGPAMFSCSLLFAAVHLHLPSLPALAVLAICLTVAYEMTGSLLVPMAMHAVFNTVSLVSLLFFPDMVMK